MKFSTLLLSVIALAATKVAGEAVPYANAMAFAEAFAFAEADAAQHGSEFATTMGEIAMLYPDDREWSEDYELDAPCGSAAGPSSNRSEMPLDNAFVALVAKTTNAWSVSLKISYNNNPTSNDDFDEWANGNVTNDIDIGHTCFYMPELPSSVGAGDNATIQLLYMAIEDSLNTTHYACADITFVEDSVFRTSVYALSCFNATDDTYYSYSDYGDDLETSTAAATTTVTAAATTSSSTSAGAAAATAVAGVSSVLALLVFNFLI